jgi:hypothetical protein
MFFTIIILPVLSIVFLSILRFIHFIEFGIYRLRHDFTRLPKDLLH